MQCNQKSAGRYAGLGCGDVSLHADTVRYGWSWELHTSGNPSEGRIPLLPVILSNALFYAGSFSPLFILQHGTFLHTLGRNSSSSLHGRTGFNKLRAWVLRKSSAALRILKCLLRGGTVPLAPGIHEHEFLSSLLLTDGKKQI